MRHIHQEKNNEDGLENLVSEAPNRKYIQKASPILNSQHKKYEEKYVPESFYGAHTVSPGGVRQPI